MYTLGLGLFIVGAYVYLKCNNSAFEAPEEDQVQFLEEEVMAQGTVKVLNKKRLEHGQVRKYIQESIYNQIAASMSKNSGHDLKSQEVFVLINKATRQQLPILISEVTEDQAT